MKSQELLQILSSLKNEVTNLQAAGKIDEAHAKLKEIEAKQKEYEVQKGIENMEKKEVENKINNGQMKVLKGDGVDNIKVSNINLEVSVFAKAMSNKPITEDREIKALSSLTDKDGKLTIPTTISTKIETWLRNYNDMAKYVDIQTVNTVSGSRVYEVEADAIPFEGVAEMTNIPDMGSPEFQKIEYTVNYYKGLLEIPNELLKNADSSLEDYISQWIAKKMVCSRNIMAFYANGNKADGLLGVDVDGIDIDKSLSEPIKLKDIDYVLNVELPMAISSSPECRLYTNQSGFNYLLSLEDNQGRRYLQQDITNPAIYRYSGKQIVVFDNNQLKNETIDSKEQFPLLVGNLREALKMFVLEGFKVETDRSIGFKNDTTVMRVIGALTTKLFDKKAVKAVYSPQE